MNQPSNPDQRDAALRREILNSLHRTEADKEFLQKHFNSPNRCDVDFAAPRCAERVFKLEKLIRADRQSLIAEIEREMPKKWKKNINAYSVPEMEYYNAALSEVTALLQKFKGEL